MAKPKYTGGLQKLKKQMERGNVSKSDYNRQVFKILNAPKTFSSGCEKNADGTFAHGNSCGGK